MGHYSVSFLSKGPPWATKQVAVCEPVSSEAVLAQVMYSVWNQHSLFHILQISGHAICMCDSGPSAPSKHWLQEIRSPCLEIMNPWPLCQYHYPFVVDAVQGSHAMGCDNWGLETQDREYSGKPLEPWSVVKLTVLSLVSPLFHWLNWRGQVSWHIEFQSFTICFHRNTQHTQSTTFLHQWWRE